MSKVFYIDFETFGEAELSDVGAYAYAEHPSTEVLMFAIARGDEEPFLWIPPKWRREFSHLHDIEADGLIAELRDDPTALVYAHNAQFERAVVMFTGTRQSDDLSSNNAQFNSSDNPLSFLRERPKQWRCTAAMARRAAVPDSLEKCGAYLNVEAKKDSRGKALIRKFSILQTAGKLKGSRILPSDDPVAFKEFAKYCVQDVRTEQAIYRALKPFELKGPAVLDTFLLDIHLNDRGIPVNIPALRNARVLVDASMTERAAQFRSLTGLEPTQRDAVKGWLAAKGVLLDDMQGATLAEILPNLSVGDARTAVELYSELRFAAVKKVHTMLDCANSDGRVRGTLLYHGAGTGRWSGRGMQPQNFKKPTIKNLKGAFQMLEAGCTAEQLDLLYGPPLEVISSCIRNFITATLDADYASIEARILPWVAGQENALQRFRDGEDSYVVMAGVIYNKRADAVTSDERQLGKAAILGAGYGMGASKFQATCEQWGIPITPELAKRAIDAFRAAHPKVKQFWYDCDNAARRAVAQMGRSFSAGDYVSFQTRRVADKDFLFLRLPSGREIAYPEPRMEVDTRETEERRGKDGWYDEPRENLTYYGAIPGTVIWGRVKLYGGKFAENIVQAIAADIMSYGANTALRAGYDIFTLIHDQSLATHKLGQTPREFGDLLATLPPWAGGLPLKAEAKLCKYYAK
jgi:DNA polymerase